MSATATAEPENIQVMNQDIINAFAEAPDGQMKNASAAGTTTIRRRIRENGFWRNIVPPREVKDSELSYLPGTELPVVVEELEPDTPAAKSMTFNDSPDTAFFRAERFVVYFHKITTREYQKNIDEMRTYKQDLRQVVTDNALRDLHTVEDTTAINTVDRINGSAVNTASTYTGYEQYTETNGGITRVNYVPILSNLEERGSGAQPLNNGCFLMNRKTGKAFLTWSRDEIGGDLAQNLFEDGMSALREAKIMGVKHLFTIKSDVIPHGYVYQFTEPGFLGRFYILQDITMYVKKERDIIRFVAWEKIGMTFANAAAIHTHRFLQVS